MQVKFRHFFFSATLQNWVKGIAARFLKTSKKTLIDAMEKANLKNKWKNSSWSKKLIACGDLFSCVLTV